MPLLSFAQNHKFVLITKDIPPNTSDSVVHVSFSLEGIPMGKQARLDITRYGGSAKPDEDYQFFPNPLSFIANGNGSFKLLLPSHTTPQEPKSIILDVIITVEGQQPDTLHGAGVIYLNTASSPGIAEKPKEQKKKPLGDGDSPEIIQLSKSLNNIEGEYNCFGNKVQMVQPKTFDESLKPIYSKVILSNDGLIKNGTAANLSVDNGINLSANYQKALSDNFFFKAGFATTVKDNISDIYSNRTFKNNFTLSFGITQILKNAAQFFNKDDCDHLQTERREFEDSLYGAYGDILSLESDTMPLMKTLDSLNALLDRNADTYSRKDWRINDAARKVVKDKLSAVRNMQKNIMKKGIEPILRDTLSGWEIKKAIKWSGYKVKWVDYDIKIPFTGYYLYNNAKGLDSLQYILLATVQAGITYNHVYNAAKFLFYFYGGAQLILNKGILATPPTDTLTRYFLGGNKVFENVTNSDYYTLFITGVSPSINLVAFFGSDKVIGIETGFSMAHYFYDKIPNSKNNIVNARAGLLFALGTKDQISKTTLGLFAQLKDYTPSLGKVINNVSVGVRVGLPFSKIF